jgi:PII-like signaling protein
MEPSGDSMRGIQGEQVLLRIIVGESQRVDHAPLALRIIELLRREGLAGATAVKGIAGFGHDRQVHSAAIEVLAQNLPIVIEVVDAAARVEGVLPAVEALMAGGGVVMTERAQVIRYGGG